MKKIIALILFAAIILVGCVIITRFIIPHPPLLKNGIFSQAVYDENQHLLRLTLSADQKYRLYTPFKDISPLIIQATLLQEDRFFYWHMGINPLAIIKAGIETYIKHSRRMGASTISMQLARIYYGINSKKMSGKLEQIFRSLQLELFYSKNDILEAYLNLAPYGGNVEGVGAASRLYFHKPAGQLLLPEALLLSVIPQNPVERAPLSPKNKQRLHEAALRLFSEWIKKHPEDNSQAQVMELPWDFSQNHLPFLAPHFVNDVLATTTSEIVITTLDLKLQKIVENIATNFLQANSKYRVNNVAALLVDSRNMEVKALLGSGNFFNNAIDGQVNGTLAKRSPGSTLKPFIYALALDQGLIHPDSILKDAPSHFSAYSPENFDGDFLGPIKAKDALTLSRNIPAITLMSQLQNPSFYAFLTAAHISQLKEEENYGLALALGGAEVSMQELASLYAMLANGGIWRPLRTQVNQPLADGERLLSPEASFLILDMLANTPRPTLTNSAIAKQFPVYWKTGTSSGYRDAWSVGLFGPYILVVWVGDFHAKSNPAFVGAKTAAPLFFDIIASIRAQSMPLPTVMADPHKLNLVRLSVCEASGMLPTRFCPHTIKTWFIPGKSPIQKDTVFREVAIDSQTGLRTCHYDEHTLWKVYEFWPSDSLKIFAEAGMKLRTPPPFQADCNLTNYAAGTAPKIISPRANLIYTLRLNDSDHPIIFSATADADVATLFWFLNNTFLGEMDRDTNFIWEAKPGKYQVRVVDDHGRANSQDLVVETVD